jgi:hypothetical protein
MMRALIGAAAVGAIAGTATGAAIDRTLYALADGSTTPGDQRLIRFDPDNPSDAEVIGSTGLAGLGFLSYDPGIDAFYAVSIDTIHVVDRYTGVATPLPNASGRFRVQGMDYVPGIQRTLIAYQDTGDPNQLDKRLGWINPDGTIDPLFDFNGDPNFVDFEEFDEIVFDPATGHVFAYDFQPAQVWEISLADGSVVSSMMLTDIPPEVFRADINPENGLLYFNGAEPSGGPGPFAGETDIFTRTIPGQAIGGPTGTVALVDQIDGMSFVPSPGTGALASLAILAGLRRRR